MIKDYEELQRLPTEFQLKWQAQLHKATPTEQGVFRLIHIEKTSTAGYDSQRINVMVVDENRLPLAAVKVAFAYDTARRFYLDDHFEWAPIERKADIFATRGGGETDHSQGSFVKAGDPGGVTVFIIEPEYSSDYITGAGA